MARLVAPAAPPLARFAAKNFQNWSGVTPAMKICLYLSGHKEISERDGGTWHTFKCKVERLGREIPDDIDHIAAPVGEETLLAVDPREAVNHTLNC